MKFVNESITIHKIGGNIKIDKVKSQANFQAKLAKFSLLIKPSIRAGF